jgi:hypothetical protein
MARHTVAELKESVSGLLQGTNLNWVTALDPAIERAARVLIQQADVIEASGLENVTLYNGVYTYDIPSKIFGTTLFDIRPQGQSTTPMDVVYKQPISQFDRTKAFLPNGYSVTFVYDNGDGYIEVSAARTIPRLGLLGVETTTDWSISGGVVANSLAVDNVVYYEAPGSLKFNLDLSSQQSWEVQASLLSNPADMTAYANLGVVFIPMWFPSVTNLDQITITIGSDINDLSNSSITVIGTPFVGELEANKWVLMAFNLADPSAVNGAAIDWSAIEYVVIDASYTATSPTIQYNMRIGGLWASLPCPTEILYGSAAIFQASGADPLQTITTDADEIILNDAAYTLLEYECAITISEQNSSGQMNIIAEGYKRKLYGNGSTDLGLYGEYRADNPSQEIRTTGSYYDNYQGSGMIF